MKKIFICFAALMLLVPAFSDAQSRSRYGNNSEGADGFTDADWERYSERRRQSSELRQKIEALGSDIVQLIPVPVAGISLSSISSNFGDPRDGGTRSHEGLDIMAPRGTAVISPTKAVVIRIGDGSSSGLTVATANPGDETFIYMHLDSIASGLAEGDVVEIGTILGYVGNTGNASGGATHLHFEIRGENRTAKDPYPRIGGTIAARVASVSTTQTPSSNSASNSIRDLELGMSGEDVRVLQKLLNTLGFRVAETGAGSPGNETATFGPATQAALIKFQAANGINPASGYFGPITRAYIARVGASAATSESVTSTTPSTPLPSTVRDLTLRDTGDDVIALQKLLIAEGHSIPAGATGYFGSQTQTALASYQRANSISPAAGYFGPTTRATMKNRGVTNLWW